MTSPNCCVSDVSCITPKLAGWTGLYTVLYPMEEIRTSCFGVVVFKLNVPSSAVTVPVTKVESGSDRRTTLA